MMRRAQSAVLMLHFAVGQVLTHRGDDRPAGDEFIQQHADSFQSYIPGKGVAETRSPYMLADANNGWNGENGHGDLNFRSDHKYMMHGTELGHQKHAQGGGQAGSDAHSGKDSSQQSFDYQKYMQGGGQGGSDSHSSKDSSQQSFDYQKYMQGGGQAGSDLQKFSHGPEKPAIADAHGEKDASQQSIDHQTHPQVSGEIRSNAHSTKNSQKEDAEQNLAKAEAAHKRYVQQTEDAREAAEAEASIERAELKKKKEHEEHVMKHAADRVQHAESLLKRSKAAQQQEGVRQLKKKKGHEEQVVKHTADRAQHAEGLVKRDETAQKQEGVRNVADHKTEGTVHVAEHEHGSKQNAPDQSKANTFFAAGQGIKPHPVFAALLLLMPDRMSCGLAAALACYASYVYRRRSQQGLLQQSLLQEEGSEIFD